MYLGQIIELAKTDEIFADALHPYTIALLSAVPKMNFKNKVNRIVLKGDVPSPINPPKGCRFAQRCFMCRELCKQEQPGLREVKEGHQVACHFYEETQEKAAEFESDNIVDVKGKRNEHEDSKDQSNLHSTGGN